MSKASAPSLADTLRDLKSRATAANLLDGQVTDLLARFEALLQERAPRRLARVRVSRYEELAWSSRLDVWRAVVVDEEGAQPLRECSRDLRWEALRAMPALCERLGLCSGEAQSAQA